MILRTTRLYSSLYLSSRGQFGRVLNSPVSLIKFFLIPNITTTPIPGPCIYSLLSNLDFIHPISFKNPSSVLQLRSSIPPRERSSFDTKALPDSLSPFNNLLQYKFSVVTAQTLCECESDEEVDHVELEFSAREAEKCNPWIGLD